MYQTDYNYNLPDTYKAITHDIELIRNNHGKYSDQDYEYILEMLDKFEKGMNYNLDKEIFDKNGFKVKELANYANKQKVSFNSVELDDLIVMLLKYDNNIFKNFKNIDDIFLRQYDYTNLINIDTDVYYYDFAKRDSYENNVLDLYLSLSSKYEIIYLTLTNIIEVGGIHE